MKKGNYPHCVDCGKITQNYKAIRCRNCYCKFIKIHPNNPRKVKQDYICNYCGNKLKRLPCQVKGKKHLFCSRGCMWKWEKQNPMPHLKKYVYIGLGKKRSLESKRRYSEARIKYMLENKVFNKNTKIEIKIEKELKNKKINYIKQAYLCKGSGIVDFYLPDFKVVIECDGEYWHSLPKAKLRDERKDFFLAFNGFKVYRFPETAINTDSLSCVQTIKEIQNVEI